MSDVSKIVSKVPLFRKLIQDTEVGEIFWIHTNSICVGGDGTLSVNGKGYAFFRSPAYTQNYDFVKATKLDDGTIKLIMTAIYPHWDYTFMPDDYKFENSLTAVIEYEVIKE